MIKRKNMLETMAATDILPYVRYSRSSVVILWLAALVIALAILSTTLLFIVGPIALLALLFFNITFITLGSNYIPTEELLDKEAENNNSTKNSKMKSVVTWSHSGKQHDSAGNSKESLQQRLFGRTCSLYPKTP